MVRKLFKKLRWWLWERFLSFINDTYKPSSSEQFLYAAWRSSGGKRALHTFKHFVSAHTSLADALESLCGKDNYETLLGEFRNAETLTAFNMLICENPRDLPHRLLEKMLRVPDIAHTKLVIDYLFAEEGQQRVLLSRWAVDPIPRCCPDKGSVRKERPQFAGFSQQPPPSAIALRTSSSPSFSLYMDPTPSSIRTNSHIPHYRDVMGVTVEAIEPRRQIAKIQDFSRQEGTVAQSGNGLLRKDQMRYPVHGHHTVQIDGLPSHYRASELIDLIAGKLYEVDIQGRTAFLTFAYCEDAIKIVPYLNNNFVDLHGSRSLRVTWTAIDVVLDESVLHLSRSFVVRNLDIGMAEAVKNDVAQFGRIEKMEDKDVTAEVHMMSIKEAVKAVSWLNSDPMRRFVVQYLPDRCERHSITRYDNPKVIARPRLPSVDVFEGLSSDNTSGAKNSAFRIGPGQAPPATGALQQAMEFMKTSYPAFLGRAALAASGFDLRGNGVDPPPGIEMLKKDIPTGPLPLFMVADALCPGRNEARRADLLSENKVTLERVFGATRGGQSLLPPPSAEVIKQMRALFAPLTADEPIAQLGSSTSGPSGEGVKLEPRNCHTAGEIAGSNNSAGTSKNKNKRDTYEEMETALRVHKMRKQENLEVAVQHREQSESRFAAPNIVLQDSKAPTEPKQEAFHSNQERAAHDNLRTISHIDHTVRMLKQELPQPKKPGVTRLTMDNHNVLPSSTNIDPGSDESMIPDNDSDEYSWREMSPDEDSDAILTDFDESVILDGDGELSGTFMCAICAYRSQNKEDTTHHIEAMHNIRLPPGYYGRL